jgi:hypothetical protein
MASMRERQQVAHGRDHDHAAGSPHIKHHRPPTWPGGCPAATSAAASPPVLRQCRGALDESDPSDMVEYHVVRNGVDESALRALLRPRFAAVRMTTYWSMQGALHQTLGALAGQPNTFGLIAAGRR